MPSGDLLPDKSVFDVTSYGECTDSENAVVTSICNWVLLAIFTCESERTRKETVSIYISGCSDIGDFCNDESEYFNVKIILYSICTI